MENGATALALHALRLLTARNVEEGASAYRRALGMPDGGDVPVWRHLQLLAGSGLADVAALVERVALREGADISSRPIANGRDPLEGAAEYEALFARGAANARMMTGYLARSVSPACQRNWRPSTTRPPCSGGRPSMKGSARPVPCRRRRCAPHCADASARRGQKVGPRGRTVRKTNTLKHPALVELHRRVGEQVAAYIADVRSSDHIIAPWVSPRFSLMSWGVISEGTGFNAPHIHGGCWVVAVAYIAGEAPGAGDGDAGAMRIGPAVEGDSACEGWPDIAVPPIPRTLVIMPAFYTHWTVPLARPGLRISVAFNADEPL